MKVTVQVSLKDSILDPQGEAISHSLKSIGFLNVNSVRQGKVIVIDLEETDHERGIKTINEMCKKLLVNDVIENFSIITD